MSEKKSSIIRYNRVSPSKRKGSISIAYSSCPKTDPDDLYSGTLAIPLSSIQTTNHNSGEWKSKRMMNSLKIFSIDFLFNFFLMKNKN